MSDRPVVYGAAYSVYVQAVRLSLWAKGVDYDLVEVDVFAPGGPDADHLARQPFGRIPAFEHGTLRLYETAPVCRYVDEVFVGPALQPGDPAGRAVMSQTISIMDNYAYRSLVWGVYVERIGAVERGRTPDPRTLEAALRQAPVILKALEALAPDGDWLAGGALTLADLHAAPMFALFMRAPDATMLMAPNPRLRRWWARISQHVAPARII